MKRRSFSLAALATALAVVFPGWTKTLPEMPEHIQAAHAFAKRLGVNLAAQEAFSMSMWMYPTGSTLNVHLGDNKSVSVPLPQDGRWHSVTISREGSFIDGMPVDRLPPPILQLLNDPRGRGYVDDVRISRG